MCTISLETRPAGIFPGQRMMNGARREASIAVKYVPRHGPLSPSHGSVASGRCHWRRRRCCCPQCLRRGWHPESVLCGNRHQSRSRRRALGFNVEIQQSRALACQLVNASCRSASQDSAAINAELPVTEVVDENKNDIRPRRSNRNLRPTGERAEERQKKLPMRSRAVSSLLLTCAAPQAAGRA